MGWRPVDLVVAVLNVAGLAADAVLGVDDEEVLAVLFRPLVDADRTVAGAWAGTDVVFRALLQIHVLDPECTGWTSS